VAQLLHLAGGGAGEEGAARVLRPQGLAPAGVAHARVLAQLLLLRMRSYLLLRGKKNIMRTTGNAHARVLAQLFLRRMRSFSLLKSKLWSIFASASENRPDHFFSLKTQLWRLKTRFS